MGFKYDINRYFASHGDTIPMKSLAEVVKSGRFHPTVQRRLEQANDGPDNGPDTPACKAETEYREQVRAARAEDDGRAQARRVWCIRPGATRRG